MANMTSQILSALHEREQMLAMVQRLSCSGTNSYFISLPWIENWLHTLPADEPLRMLVLHDSDGPSCAFFFGTTEMHRRYIIRSRTYFLNQTGKPEIDQLYIQYNGVLCRPDVRINLDSILASLPGGWEEFTLAGVPEDSELLHPPAGCKLRVNYNRPSLYVDLAKVRQAEDYLNLLNASVRWQIRRSYRVYEEKFGSVQLDVPATKSEAFTLFDEMVQLHQRRWNEKNLAGAFANPYFLGFHRRLIDQRFDFGDIQLLRVRAGSTTLGIVYSLIANGTVSFYQSGCRLEEDNRLKPGLVTHTEIIRHNARLGHMIYDFLAGEARYKEELSTSSRRLVWASIQKLKTKFLIEDLLCGATRKYRDGRSWLLKSYDKLRAKRSPSERKASESA